jgi:hypothetical protein
VTMNGSNGRGRPPCCPRELAVHIIELRRQGLSYRTISTVLNSEGISTPAGGEVAGSRGLRICAQPGISWMQTYPRVARPSVS